jgi:hypothetical protein
MKVEKKGAEGKWKDKQVNSSNSTEVAMHVIKY